MKDSDTGAMKHCYNCQWAERHPAELARPDMGEAPTPPWLKCTAFPTPTRVFLEQHIDEALAKGEFACTMWAPKLVEEESDAS